VTSPAVDNREAYVADLKNRPLAEQTAAANEQHYEVPMRFYQLCLGKRNTSPPLLHRKDLDQADNATPALDAERAQLADGQTILGVGCGCWLPRPLQRREIPPRPHHRDIELAHRKRASTPKRKNAALPISPSSPPT